MLKKSRISFLAKSPSPTYRDARWTPPINPTRIVAQLNPIKRRLFIVVRTKFWRRPSATWLAWTELQWSRQSTQLCLLLAMAKTVNYDVHLPNLATFLVFKMDSCVESEQLFLNPRVFFRGLKLDNRINQISRKHHDIISQDWMCALHVIIICMQSTQYNFDSLSRMYYCMIMINGINFPIHQLIKI